MTPTDGSSARPRVHIVDSVDTSEASDEIIRQLDALGVDASAPLPTTPGEVRAIVVLLSDRALQDPVWMRRVEALRDERLVPVSVGVSEHGVPDFLRELNWVFYRSQDQEFVARLFTGINTDIGRFRSDRDTRALAERWLASDRNPDLLVDDIREVKRRTEDAGLTAERARSESSVSAQFLAASRALAVRTRIVRIWRATYRSAIAIAAVAAVVFTVDSVQQAIHRSNNSVSFAVGDPAAGVRPDIAAFKAGASLADAGDFDGADGRFRIAVDALSRHWPLGYLSVGEWAIAAIRFEADGSLVALDQGGTVWRWTSALEARNALETDASVIRGGDIADADVVVGTDGSRIVTIDSAGTSTVVAEFDDIADLRVATSSSRILVSAGGHLHIVPLDAGTGQQAEDLGVRGTVIDMAQTTDGGVVALVEQDGVLHLVGDDGSSTPVGPSPGPITSGSLAADGSRFALDVEGTIWTSIQASAPVSSGIRIPGVLIEMQMSNDGLVFVSDRTRGTWVADPELGIDLGSICIGLSGITEIAIEPGGDRVLCVQGTRMLLDSLDGIRPADRGVAVAEPAHSAASSGAVESVSIRDGLVVIDRADARPFALDTAGVSFDPAYVRPEWVDDVEFFATGALIGARGTPTSVAVSEDGGTFAIGFVGGTLIEVDVDAEGHMARVGSWQFPDHVPVNSISWSDDETSISATSTEGVRWERASCAGCWSEGTLNERIVSRAWLCYEAADIDQLGEAAKELFRLRDCESRWGAGS
ncbi:hypothetical protein [Microbacterium sp. W4I20]|uniref:hypothetical protein n=1 Tax=Microbacterium sp. W4I20 TaxID=3042262 RepID=UPI00277E8F05|nr:hypothetical protein [Microbacterium sp. W4I20]MDQ0725198.1 hypothetical protein [Microbacterium sp. W4I20]